MPAQAIIRTALLLGLIGLGTSVVAQSKTAPAGNTGYPEDAYLSPTRYINQYFGFCFDLPAEAHLHPVPEPTSRDASVPLLDLAGPAPADAEVLIAALPIAPSKNSDDAKLVVRQALDQELYRGVEELRGLSKASFSGHQFYLFETRRGIEQHIFLATTAGDFVLRVVLMAHDEKVLKKLETSFQHVTFFEPTQSRQYLDAGAKPYDGPSISSHRLAQLESDPPAKHIDGGNLSGDFYENSMLGFSYRIPQGWSIESSGAVQPAIEEYRLKQDSGRPRMGRVEHSLVEACSRTLFSAWAKRPGADGQVSYEDFDEVTISAMSLGCFPNMKFPGDPNDRDAFRTFLAEYALTHPIVQDMRDGKVFSQDGIPFLFLQGTVAFQVPGEELSRRLSLGLAIAQRRGYLLSWFFAAPHEGELRALTNERVSFDRDTHVTVAHAAQPGGGVAADSASASTASTGAPPAASSAGAAPAQSPSSADNTTQATSAAAPAPAPSGSGDGTDGSVATNASRPSLLRPGETMDSQQGNGAPIGKKKSY